MGVTLSVLCAGIVTAVVASPASAGRNGNMWIGVNTDPVGTARVSVQQVAGVSGTYHIDIWYAATGARYGGTGDYYYNGGTREFLKGRKSEVAGKRLCAQLWYHKPGGGYESQGLPCHDY
ncbi:hypothetical protein [Nonomuraea sp. B19D2]|uniref:hypothetical protein n=1 Tax=Nonomuraea sp. B19D2 TaxID=3159561 RepID=UPI0032DBCE61